MIVFWIIGILFFIVGLLCCVPEYVRLLRYHGRVIGTITKIEDNGQNASELYLSMMWMDITIHKKRNGHQMMCFLLEKHVMLSIIRKNLIFHISRRVDNGYVVL